MHDIEQIERGLMSALGEAQTPPAFKRRRPPSVAIGRRGLTVRLAVREKPLAMDHEFVHESDSISRLQARIEAEQAARAEGWIVGHVIDVEER